MTLDPNDARLVTGTVEQQRQARAEWRRQQRIEQARKSGMQELEPSDLEPGRFHLTHLPTGRLYRVTRGEQFVGLHDTATAYYVTDVDQVVFLEPLRG